MAPKQQLEKAAWQWAESVRPEEVRREHIELAYRVLLGSCRRDARRRNCRGNPNCLVGLGEHVWLGEIDENSFHNIDDPNSERRCKNTFVGLTNLGATCYVNTLLQVWFHNLELRQALYLCHSPRKEMGTGERIEDDADFEPQSVCEHLQYLFALLQSSNRRYIDPSGFVKALGLDTGQQQDAQEFSKLFMSLLEDTLSKQNNPDVQNIIQQQFCGQYAYVTVCNQCGWESKLLSRFYELELNIQGHKQLTDCIEEFLKEEKLEGDNRYFCDKCQDKQNATRKIKLLNLPRTLNLQLLRFVFDRQTGHKKKLNSYISFPEVLDLSPYLERKDVSTVYELSAVLIHRGVSAYSGHYIAHVRDDRTGDWYKFNDEEIEKMEGKKLQLGIEEDLAEPSKSQTRKPKCVKGVHCSRNAYMLVYRRKGEMSKEKDISVQLPAHLQKMVERDNKKFEEWCMEMAEMRKQSVDKGKAKHEEVQELFNMLPAKEDELYEFVPVDWLRKWLDDSAVTKPIDNSCNLCAHGGLNPDKICDVKRISQKAADIFYARYGGGPRLDASALCADCVMEKCRILRLKNQLNEDYKIISNLTRTTLQSLEGYWVGKTSLRSWRQLALDQLDGKDDDSDLADGKSNGEDDEMTGEKDNEDMNFNEDLVCPHGEWDLCTSETERRLVSEETWKRLKAYFPKSPEFAHYHSPCVQCQVLEKEGEENETLSKMMANEQKSALLCLFQEKNRPILIKWPEETDVLYIVSQFFVEEWKKFIRKPTKCSPVSSVGNNALLCPHGGLMFTAESMTKEDSKHVALIWPNEWEILHKLFVVDNTIKVICYFSTSLHPLPPLPSQTPPIGFPWLCVECREGLLCQQQRDLREYTQATIYIRKVVDNIKVMKEGAPELNMSGSEAEEEREEFKIEGEKDPDFNQSNGAKRRKLAHLCIGNTHSSVHYKPGIRRSTRHRVRGEKELLVSANQTLKELKIQIMHAFSVAPFDQNLSLEGRMLTDDTATLGNLGIIPESVILLKVLYSNHSQLMKAIA
uniref:Ubiquitin carboxyl-terminal hydrolase 48 n=1 Tax=Callorhinchus milii TaxID=7868 RepID=A0A4W3H452_CALMI